MADLFGVQGRSFEKALVQTGDRAQSLLFRGIDASSTGQDRGDETAGFIQGFAQRSGKRLDDAAQRRFRRVEGLGYGPFDPFGEYLFDRLDELLFACKPSVYAADGDSGVFGDPGNGEVFQPFVDKDLLGRASNRCNAARLRAWRGGCKLETVGRSRLER